MEVFHESPADAVPCLRVVLSCVYFHCKADDTVTSYLTNFYFSLQCYELHYILPSFFNLLSSSFPPLHHYALLKHL